MTTDIQPQPRITRTDRPVVAFGPELPEIGSWEWVGREMADELANDFQTTTFKYEVPACDVLVIVKYNLPLELVRQVSENAAVIFCPIDYYGSSAEIDRDARMLCRCSRIVTHAEELRSYFQSYAPVEYLDHHVKYVSPLREEFPQTGPILWIGMRTNLPPLVEWVNAHPLPGELLILTNLEDLQAPVTPGEFGFHQPRGIRIEPWSHQRHIAAISAARCAIDIKGTDFRQRHKPPAKAFDFLASGLPLAMNSESSSVQHLKRMGFDPAAPDDPDRWLSRAYWEETVRFGRAIRELLSRERIGRRFKRIVTEVLQERSVL